MKKAALITLSALLLIPGGLASAADDGAKICTNEAPYKKYLCNVEQICKKGDWYDKDKQLIRANLPPYFEIENIEKAQKDYFSSLEKLGVPKERILSELGGTTIQMGANAGSPFSPIDTFDFARIAYRETMNNIYKCAILNVKLTTGQRILETKMSEKSALKNKIEKEAKQIRSQMQKFGCRAVSNVKTADPSVKLEILNNTTYQQCAYGFYLSDYLQSAYKSRFDAFLKTKDGEVSDALYGQVNSPEKIKNFFGAKTAQISQEIDRSRRIYKQAFVSYNEFERAYEMHLWLTFIAEDYANLRDNLKKLMNPIGQVIYKISNAQSPGK